MVNKVSYRDPTPNNFPNDYDPAKVDPRVKLRSDSIKDKQKGKYTREAMYQALEIGSVTANEAKSTAINTASRQDKTEKIVNEGIGAFTEDSEVKIARDGHENLLLKEQHQDKQIGEFVELEHGFEYWKNTPYYITKLEGSVNRVAQSFYFDNVNNNWYETQVYDDSGAIESYVITRHDINGNRLDSMYVKNGGHGTSIGVQVDGDEVYIWSPMAFNSGSETAWQLVRFAYTPNAQGDEVSFKIYQNFANALVSPYLDAENKLMALFVQDNINNRVEVRRLDDVINNKDEVINSFKVDNRIMQGLAIDGESLYWLTGLSTEKQTLDQYDLKDSSLIGTLDINFGQDANGNLPGNYREPEGLCLHTDQFGQKSLFVGLSVGAVGARQFKIYSFSQRGALANLNTLLNASPTLGTADVGGLTKPVPDGIVNISEIKEIGDYYLASDLIAKLGDNPMPGTTGFAWWLNNSAKSPTGAVIQTVRRNSNYYSPVELTRVVTGSSVGPWSVRMTVGAHADAVPSSLSKLSDLATGGSYYITKEQSAKLSDHPEPNVSGWFFNAGQRGSDPQASRIDFLIQANTGNPQTIYSRLSRTDGTSGPWNIISKAIPRILNNPDGLIATQTGALTDKVSQFRQLEIGYWFFDNYNTVKIDVINTPFPVIRHITGINLSSDNDSWDLGEMQLTINETSLRIDWVKIITNGTVVTKNTSDMKITWVDGIRS